MKILLFAFAILINLPGLARADSVIAFTRGEAICTAGADGKNVKTVIRHGADPCISNVGKFIVYTASKGKNPAFTRSLRLHDPHGQGDDVLFGEGRQVDQAFRRGEPAHAHLPL